MFPSKAPTITLYSGFAARGCYAWSAFVTKLEFRLRLGDIPYNVETGSLSQAPNGKIPYVDLGPLLNQDSNTQTLMGDSALISRRLADMGRLSNLNESLSARDATFDLATRSLLEERLYFLTMRERWIENYYIHRDKILQSIPYLMRVIVGILVYRKYSQLLHGQGTGRFSWEQIQTFQKEIWESLDASLETSRRASEKREPFWFLAGPNPTEVDTVLYAFLVSALVADSGPATQKLLKTFPAIMDYVERIHAKYFPDYEKWP